MMQSHIRTIKTNGFTMIEMAIVLTVVAIVTLLVAGGRDLLESNKVSSVISELTYYKNANDSFAEKYKYRAGDVPVDAADKYFKGNAAADCGLSSLGNGIWDSLPEQSMAWVQLSSSSLIRDKIDFDACNTSTVRPGFERPASGVDQQAGYTFLGSITVDNFLQGAASTPARYLKVLRVGKANSTDLSSGGFNVGVHRSIDAKIDQADTPFSGKYIVSENCVDRTPSTGTLRYLETNSDINCVGNLVTVDTTNMQVSSFGGGGGANNLDTYTAVAGGGQQPTQPGGGNGGGAPDDEDDGGTVTPPDNGNGGGTPTPPDNGGGGTPIPPGNGGGGGGGGGGLQPDNGDTEVGCDGAIDINTGECVGGSGNNGDGGLTNDENPSYECTYSIGSGISCGSPSDNNQLTCTYSGQGQLYATTYNCGNDHNGNQVSCAINPALSINCSNGYECAYQSGGGWNCTYTGNTNINKAGSPKQFTQPFVCTTQNSAYQQNGPSNVLCNNGMRCYNFPNQYGSTSLACYGGASAGQYCIVNTNNNTVVCANDVTCNIVGSEWQCTAPGNPPTYAGSNCELKPDGTFSGSCYAGTNGALCYQGNPSQPGTVKCMIDSYNRYDCTSTDGVNWTCQDLSTCKTITNGDRSIFVCKPPANPNLVACYAYRPTGYSCQYDHPGDVCDSALAECNKSGHGGACNYANMTACQNYFNPPEDDGGDDETCDPKTQSCSDTGKIDYDCRLLNAGNDGAECDGFDSCKWDEKDGSKGFSCDDNGKSFHCEMGKTLECTNNVTCTVDPKDQYSFHCEKASTTGTTSETCSYDDKTNQFECGSGLTCVIHDGKGDVLSCSHYDGNDGGHILCNNGICKDANKEQQVVISCTYNDKTNQVTCTKPGSGSNDTYACDYDGMTVACDKDKDGQLEFECANHGNGTITCKGGDKEDYLCSGNESGLTQDQKDRNVEIDYICDNGTHFEKTHGEEGEKIKVIIPGAGSSTPQGPSFSCGDEHGGFKCDENGDNITDYSCNISENDMSCENEHTGHITCEIARGSTENNKTFTCDNGRTYTAIKAAHSPTVLTGYGAGGHGHH